MDSWTMVPRDCNCAYSGVDKVIVHVSTVQIIICTLIAKFHHTLTPCKSLKTELLQFQREYLGRFYLFYLYLISKFPLLKERNCCIFRGKTLRSSNNKPRTWKVYEGIDCYPKCSNFNHTLFRSSSIRAQTYCKVDSSNVTTGSEKLEYIRHLIIFRTRILLHCTQCEVYITCSDIRLNVTTSNIIRLCGRCALKTYTSTSRYGITGAFQHL